MSESRVIAITPDMRVNQEAILTLTDAKAVNEFIINADDSAVIIRLAIINQKINALCTHPDLAEHWKNIWRQCGTQPKELAKVTHNPIQEYLPIPTLSCFELVKAHFVYEMYRKKKHSKIFAEVESSPQILRIAADLGSYFALNAMCQRQITLLKQSLNFENAYEHLTKLLVYVQKAADIYWTPGYLLVANVYQELAGLSKKYLFDAETVSPNYFKLALKALKMAQKLEPYSDAMMNIAYQGKKLSETNYKAKSWLQAKLNLLDQSGGYLTMADINDDREVNNQFTEIKKKFNLGQEEVKSHSPRARAMQKS